MQRVSDERLAGLISGMTTRGSFYGDTATVKALALDLRDARARNAALEAVARAAVKWRVGDDPDLGRVHLDHFVVDAVDALPEEMRKELGDG